MPKVAENVRKRAVNRKTVAEAINTPAEPEKAVTSEIPEKLPWEKDMADGTGIEVEKTDDGVKVTARYFEPAPAEPFAELKQAVKKLGEAIEDATKNNLLNDEIEL